PPNPAPPSEPVNFADAKFGPNNPPVYAPLPRFDVEPPPAITRARTLIGFMIAVTLLYGVLSANGLRSSPLMPAAAKDFNIVAYFAIAIAFWLAAEGIKRGFAIARVGSFVLFGGYLLCGFGMFISSLDSGLGSAYEPWYRGWSVLCSTASVGLAIGILIALASPASAAWFAESEARRAGGAGARRG
ncbi:hypothetical protein, partial [Stackebrandtia soli]|uniref:hypothetical protein n=1 Tax=Stackebrandtia soli TaxID=1892856 RepID=UPI0039E76298